MFGFETRLIPVWALSWRIGDYFQFEKWPRFIELERLNSVSVVHITENIFSIYLYALMQMWCPQNRNWLYVLKSFEMNVLMLIIFMHYSIGSIFPLWIYIYYKTCILLYKIGLISCKELGKHSKLFANCVIHQNFKIFSLKPKVLQACLNTGMFSTVGF